MNNNIFKLLNLIFLSILLFNACNIFGPGTYVRAEYYSMKITEEELIETIKEFKDLYPQYRFLRNQPDGSLKERKDQYLNNTYIIYFYIPDRDLILHCVIKRDNNNLAKIGLHNVSDTNFAGFGSINTSELTKSENAEFKKLFEEKILIPLKELILEE